MDTRYYSKTTGCSYLTSLHGANMPTDAVPIDEERFLSVIGNPAPERFATTMRRVCRF